MTEFSDFLQIQTGTAWGRTLADFAEWCTPSAGNRLLDLGCGPGLLPALFAQCGCRAFGLDNDFSLLADSRRFNFSSVINGAVYHLPFSPASFDFLTSTNVIFLLGDPLRALRECHRVLRAGGQLALLNPSELLTVEAATTLADARGLDGRNRESLLGWAKRAEKHSGWTEESARKLLKEAGFKMTRTELRLGPGFARLVRAEKQA